MGRTLIIHILTLTAILQSTAGCPFPGIPKNGEGKLNNSLVLEFNSNTTYYENDVIDYTCSSGWMSLTENHTNITCKHERTWTGEVPKCRNYLNLSSVEILRHNITLYRSSTEDYGVV